ncbi:circumsporozoite protein [Chelonia mydas]|uniref:circumsporozoite protein n=1 Tax=Chelonia mydas TaxID=8469 RepID=UPI0018A1CC24|nr:circumsporozoite protein [Chelonia mydas]
MLDNARRILVEILEELSDKDFENFKWYLKNEADEKKMRVSSLDGADRKETIDKMVSHFGSNEALEKARKVLEAIPRKDLADKLMKKESGWKTSSAEEKVGAEGDHGEGAQGDNGGRAQGDNGGGARGDNGEGAQGDSGGRVQGDNGGGARGDNGGGARGDSGGRVQGDNGGGARGDNGGGARGDNGEGAQGDSGEGAQKLKERLVAGVTVLGLGCLGMIATVIVPSGMFPLIPLGAAVLGYLCDKRRGL